jgi:hypothetical protein
VKCAQVSVVKGRVSAPSRGGRPTREQQLRRAIAAAPQLSKFDVRALLCGVVAAENTPPDLRVQALIALSNDHE